MMISGGNVFEWLTTVEQRDDMGWQPATSQGSTQCEEFCVGMQIETMKLSGRVVMGGQQRLASQQNDDIVRKLH